MRTNLDRRQFAMLRHLQSAWDRAARERVDGYLTVERERAIFDLILSADISGGKYAGWLSAWRIRRWETDGLRSSVDLSDLRELQSVLRRFATDSAHLPVAARDIGRYRSASDLQDALDGVQFDSNANRARAGRERAQTETLYDAEGWTLISLDGPDAARRWGWGTRWCTASSESRYDSYRLGGNLLVLVTPNGKFQLATASLEFRDTADRSADLGDSVTTAPQPFRAALEKACRRR